MLSLSRSARVLEGVEKTLALVLLIGVLGLTFAQVIARFVFSSPFFWTEELARYGYVWLSFVASVFVMRDRSHITVQILDARMPPWLRLVLNSLANAAVIATCALLVFGASDMVFEGHGGASPALGIPTTLFYGVVYACFAFMGLYSVLNLALDFRHYRTGEKVESMGENMEGAL